MKKISFFILLVLFMCFPRTLFATPLSYEAQIVSVLEEKTVEVLNQQQPYQKLQLVILSGEKKGSEIVVEHGLLPMLQVSVYQKGDKVMIEESNQLGTVSYTITDVVRKDPLFLLFLLFCALTFFIGRWKGLFSLIGMGISFAVIFTCILPLIIRGFNPVFVAIIGSACIIPVTFYLSHGINRKTTIAIISTIFALVLTGILAALFSDLAQLTGFASEEAGFLQSILPDVVSMRGLLLAGMIIGTLGVLDDITVSQAAIVQELHKTDPKLKRRALYQKAMEIGRDHISSMVNTLVLVYAGASLPLLLLFIESPRPFTEILNYEIIADEVVRTLVGSIGLVLAVPITTLFSAIVFSKQKG